MIVAHFWYTTSMYDDCIMLDDDIVWIMNGAFMLYNAPLDELPFTDGSVGNELRSTTRETSDSDVDGH